MNRKIQALGSGTRVKLRDQGDDVFMVWSHKEVEHQIFYTLQGLSGVFLRSSLVTTKLPVTQQPLESPRPCKQPYTWRSHEIDQ